MSNMETQLPSVGMRKTVSTCPSLCNSVCYLSICLFVNTCGIRSQERSGQLMLMQLQSLNIYSTYSPCSAIKLSESRELRRKK